MYKRLLSALALMLVATASWAQVLNIGGHRAVFDSINNMWLCSIPQSSFGSDYTATINYGDTISEFAVDGNLIANGEECVFENVMGGKKYIVTAQLNDTIPVEGFITFTWLPIVELYGDFTDYYSYATVVVSEPDSALAEPMFAKIKRRGHSTNHGSAHKLNFRIKFLNPEDSTKENHRFFGLRDDNTWLLDGGQRDMLRVRNRVSTDLWLDMSRRPWYTDSLPNAHNGSRGQMVEVLHNGKYMGFYSMCEPIDRKQLKLKRYDEENEIFHGLMYEASIWTRTATMSDPDLENYNPNMAGWDGLLIKYPDYDEIGRVYWGPMYNAIMFAGRADNSIKLRADSMGYYFDMPVMEDYYIFVGSIQALDNESKNIFYSCYDNQVHPRLTMTPWDLDISLGGQISPEWDSGDLVIPERRIKWISHLPMACMMGVKKFRNEVHDRYVELRKTYLNPDSLVERFRTVINNLDACGAIDREESRWSYDQDINWKALNIRQEMDYLEDWLRRRIAFLDENEFLPAPEYDPGDVNGDGEVTIADVNLLIDIILGAEDNTEGRSDVNVDGEVGIADVNVVIDIILNS